MTILITGGAGFIGSHLVQRLLATTDEPLVVLDNLNDFYDPTLKRQNMEEWIGHPRVTFVEGDFCDPELCTQLFLDHPLRAVCHLGAAPGVPASLKQPRLCIQTNVLGTLNLLEAARRRPVERFLFASSSTVYGRGAAVPFVEDAPLGIPASPYGVSKRSAELLGLSYYQLYGVPFVSLRFFNVYGPRLRPDLALAVFTRAILEGTPLPLFGDGSVLRDFTHVHDICRGVLSALTTGGLGGECINLGHDRPVAIRDLIRMVEQAAGRRAVIEHHPPRAEDLPRTHADLTKARRLLGYQPQIALEDGVREYVEWYAQVRQGSSR